MLRTTGDALDTAAEELVPLAMAETHYPEARCRGELGRTTFQLRLMADTVEHGSHLEAGIDSAAPEWGTPRPDLRRLMVPLGPVVVFGASNFPFAFSFSTAGGDTASALAAGCPVVVKGHPGHPRLALRTAELLTRALSEAGLPDGTFSLVTGVEAGRRAVTHPRTRAVAVTHAMTHGGPYPATTASGHTSVGTASIRRFLRPVTSQSVPQSLLPRELRDDNPLGVPQQVSGRPSSPVSERVPDGTV